MILVSLENDQSVSYFENVVITASLVMHNKKEALT